MRLCPDERTQPRSSRSAQVLRHLSISELEPAAKRAFANLQAFETSLA